MSDGKIKKFLSGNIFIEIKGLRIEDLFEICKSSGIKIINARRVSYTGIEAEISCYYFRKLEKIMRKEAYEINIKKKCGLPFKILNKKTLFFIFEF